MFDTQRKSVHLQFFKVLWDFQRSIALSKNNLLAPGVLVLTCGLLPLLGCMSLNVAMYFSGIMEGVSKYIEWWALTPEKNKFLKRVENKCTVNMSNKLNKGRALPVFLRGVFAKNINRTT